jgi:hypothetical protein
MLACMTSTACNATRRLLKTETRVFVGLTKEIRSRGELTWPFHIHFDPCWLGIIFVHNSNLFVKHAMTQFLVLCNWGRVGLDGHTSDTLEK